MLPVLFNLGPFPVRVYGPMIAIGFLVALFFVLRDAKREGIDPHIFENAAFWTLPIGILGARIAHIAMFPGNYSLSDPLGWIAVWQGGLVFQGAPPAAIVFIYLYMRKHDVSFLKTCDVVFPYLPLAHGFGRVGCFFNGCCYGEPSNLPWAISFPRIPADPTQTATGSPAYLDHYYRFADITAESSLSHPVHPTQLYSLAGLVGICLLLLLLRKIWHPFQGFLMPVYFVAYSFFRFCVEFLRGDHNPVHLGVFTDQQIVAIVLATLGIALFVFMWLQSRKIAPTNATS